MNVIYSLPYCSKCTVVKNYMKEHNIPFQEKDFEGADKKEYKKFYAANRHAIYRSPSGRIELPVFTDGQQIRQGAGPVIAHLQSGTLLDDFFSVGIKKGEWVDQIHISGGDPKLAPEFLKVIRFLKANGMQLEMDTNGKNSALLQQILQEGLADVIIFLTAPEGEMTGDAETQKSLALIAEFPELTVNRLAPIADKNTK